IANVPIWQNPTSISEAELRDIITAAVKRLPSSHKIKANMSPGRSFPQRGLRTSRDRDCCDTVARRRCEYASFRLIR
ncbi:MAG TPA: hypothetical protein VFO15_09385, partial [Xanthobacteraceae bacterium]|nr:hypothetical protein [Xanthobacteraceae bacterium]